MIKLNFLDHLIKYIFIICFKINATDNSDCDLKLPDMKLVAIYVNAIFWYKIIDVIFQSIIQKSEANMKHKLEERCT